MSKALSRSRLEERDSVQRSSALSHQEDFTLPKIGEQRVRVNDYSDGPMEPRALSVTRRQN